MNIDERNAIQGRTVVLFDGLCGLCHGVVRFLIRNDPAGKLLFAPLESSLGRELNPHPAEIDGIVVLESALTANQRVTARSDAAVRILRLLPGAWPLAGLLLAAVPGPVRDAAYRLIAKWRYKVFASQAECSLPSTAERARILSLGH